MKLKKVSFLSIVALLALVLTACPASDAVDPDPEPTPIADALEANDLNTLAAALAAAEIDLDATLAGAFTVFAPSDEAFAELLDALGVADLDALIDAIGVEGLQAVLQYHVNTEASIMAETVFQLEAGLVGTLEGSPLWFSGSEDDGVTLNGVAEVTAADVEVEDGVVHVIDTVLPLPDSVVELLGENEVPPVETDAEGQAIVFFDAGARTLTVFGAYTDLEVGGPGAHIHGPADENNNAGVLFPLDFDNDLNVFTGIELELSEDEVAWFANGLLYINLHSEDNPPGEIRGQILTDTEIELGELTIWGLATTTADAAILAEAVAAAGLAEALADPDAELTVFVPDNEAFLELLADLEFDSLEELIEELGDEVITDILRYHVVAGVVVESDALIEAESGSFETLQGSEISFEVVGGEVILNGVATVTLPDISASNGVVHLIDAVLPIPAEEEVDVE